MLGVFFISLAALAYEILLMRMLAIVHIAQFTVVIISLALLGFGWSGSFLFSIKSRFQGDPKRIRRFFIANALGFALMGYLGFYGVGMIPVHPGAWVWDSAEVLPFAGLFFMLSVPFFLAANAIGIRLMTAPAVDRIYAADLIGAGAGAGLTVAALLVFSVQQVLFLVCAAGVLAAVMALPDSRSRSILGLLIGMGVFVALTLLPTHSLKLSEYKNLRRLQQIPGGLIMHELSGPDGLLTLVASPQVPFANAPGLSPYFAGTLPEQLGIFLDGDAFMSVDRAGASGYLHYLLDDLTYRQTREGVSAAPWLHIGLSPTALQHARSHDPHRVIELVDPNPLLLSLLKAPQLGSYTAWLFADPQLILQTESPRAFLASTVNSYGLIVLNTATSFSQAFLNEMLTREALALLHSRLAADGLLAITLQESMPARLVLRVWTTLLETFTPDQLVAVQSLQTILILASKQAFSIGKRKNLSAKIRSQGFTSLYVSEDSLASGPALDLPRLLQRLADPRERPQALAAYPFAIDSVGDDRAFVNHFVKLPQFFTWISAGSASTRNLIDAAYYTSWVSLLIAVIFTVLLILLPLFFLRRSFTPLATSFPAVIVYFLSLGLGFMILEVSVMQKLQLYFSDQIYAIAIVLSSFLLFAGLGSATVQRIVGWKQVASSLPHWIITVYGGMLLGLIVAGEAYIFTLPHGVITVGIIFLLAPLAFFMGMPFVLGIHHLTKHHPGLVAWAWGINGGASVVSALLGSLLHRHLGFSTSIGVALGLYVLAGVTIILAHR
jgi:hypothetical protein